MEAGSTSRGHPPGACGWPSTSTGWALLYGLLAAGVGALVFAYASAYVPRHLAQQDRPAARRRGCTAPMVLFLVSMIGLTTARDLIALFVFWDLTAVASWLLIGFDRDDRDARLSALMALLVTTISAVLMLVGILMLRARVRHDAARRSCLRARTAGRR